MKFYIETERLILRDLLPTDAEDMYRLDSNADVHRYLGNKPLTSLEQTKEVIVLVRNQYETNGIGRWAAIEKSSGNFIGWTGLKFITEPLNNRVNYYDVGYRLHPDFWRKGYAIESTKAALKYAFNELDANEIIGTCHEENIASRKALEKCGLTFVEKFIYQNELTCDWLKITKETWQELQ